MASSMDINRRVVVAMSGGVDSSVAALLLVEQGFDVTGVMLRLWSAEGGADENTCCTPDSVEQARRVAAQIGIPFYVLDARQLFRQRVVEDFLRAHAGGLTPNPCVVCNRDMRWGYLLDQATAMGAGSLATGHYARIRRNPDGSFSLLRGVDGSKDQSYMLSQLTQEHLAQTIFPLGEMTKLEVRRKARQAGLSTAGRGDSQDLCFLGGSDLPAFLQRYAPPGAPGPILNQQGRVLGEHGGLALYTIGQRKGIRISGRQALYVLAKDLHRNALIVGTADELGSRECMAAGMNWICGQPSAPLKAQVKIRYRAEFAWGTVTPLAGGRARVVFDQPLRDITPGQAAVIYTGDEVVGGGFIQP